MCIVNRSNHFGSPNLGHGLAGEKSPAQNINQQTPFTTSVQAVGSVDVQSSRHKSAHMSSDTPYAYHAHRPSSVAPKAEPPVTPQRSIGLSQPKSGTLAHALQANETKASERLTSEQPPQPPAFVETPVSQKELTDDLEQPGVDLQIKALFTAMGRASQMSRSQLAARLQTSQDLIASLENGLLQNLPEWEDLEPVISRYSDLMNIDERPILRRLREQITEHTLSNMTAEAPAPTLQAPSVRPQTQQQAQAYNQPLEHRIQENQADGAHSDMPPQTPPLAQDKRSLRDLSNGGVSLMPQSDEGLKAFASGNRHPSAAYQKPAQHPAVAPDMSPAQPQHLHSIEDRFSALTSAVTQSQNSSHIIAQSQTNAKPLDVRAAIAGAPLHGTHQGQYAQQPSYTNPNFIQNAHAQHGSHQETPKSRNKWLRVFGNVALVFILLVGFISWQPNRFWSGVDQLPQPISKSIYAIFEFVMPDPLASVYRMNWVHVADPRMRKADKLPVPAVRKLPRIDFSKLGN